MSDKTTSGALFYLYHRESTSLPSRERLCTIVEGESYTNDGTGFNLSLQNYCIVETFAQRLVCILFVNSLYNRKLFRIFEH